MIEDQNSSVHSKDFPDIAQKGHYQLLLNKKPKSNTFDKMKGNGNFKLPVYVFTDVIPSKHDSEDVSQLTNTEFPKMLERKIKKREHGSVKQAP